ncbi:MAG: hypothetical protein F9K35_04125 [Burkholderiaceae bacterium]|nr:MAG: hypothetical protein F9K35_04125 [Burkholderiaceae bacterium]
MASPSSLQRLHRLIWLLIYGGLLTLVLGLSVARTDTELGWSLVGAGAVAAAVGVVLVWVRSRLREDPR